MRPRRAAPRAGAALAAAAVLAAAPAALAHAFLERARPAVGSTVPASPQAIELDFTEAVEAAFSTIELIDRRTGRPVRAAALEHPEPQRLALPVAPLGAGGYEVRWRVVSVDTHATEGSFRFEVAPQ